MYRNLDESAPIASQPRKMKIELKDHQLVELFAARRVEKEGGFWSEPGWLPEQDCGPVRVDHHWLSAGKAERRWFIGTAMGIIGDPPGTGKTNVALALTCRRVAKSLRPVSLKIDARVVVQNPSGLHITATVETRTPQLGNLIVVPHTLTAQWVSSIAIAGLSDRTRTLAVVKDYQELLTPEGYLDYQKALEAWQPYQIILVSYTMYKKLYSQLANFYWDRFIIDELDSLRAIPKVSIPSNFSWVLTGTPERIAEGYGHGIFSHQGHLRIDLLAIRCDPFFAKRCMGCVDPIHLWIQFKPNKLSVALRSLVDPTAQELLQANDAHGLMAYLGCPAGTITDLSAAMTQHLEKSLEKVMLEISAIHAMQTVKPDWHQAQLLGFQHQATDLCHKKDSIIQRIAEESKDCCMICCDDLRVPAITHCCKHVYCMNCITTCLEGPSVCPMCRTPLDITGFSIVSEAPIEDAPAPITDPEQSTLFFEHGQEFALEQVLARIIKYDPAPKILVFSANRYCLDKSNRADSINRLICANPSGAGTRVAKICQKFADGEIELLLLDVKSMASGLNLHHANYVIILGHIEIDTETQVIGRAQRFPRSRPLRIIYLKDSRPNDPQITILTNTSQLKPIAWNAVVDEMDREFAEERASW